MSGIGTISEEIGEALSRASVLKALDSSYTASTPRKDNNDRDQQRKGKNSTPFGKADTPKSGGKKNPNDVVVAMLQTLVGESSNKNSKFFMEQIKGKSIILENVKAQTEATKYSEQEKRFTNMFSIVAICG